MKYPLSDDYMIFDSVSNRYVLTTKGVYETVGVNLDERTKNNEAKSALLRLASMQIYNYIHKHNTENDFQDHIA